MEYIVEAWTVNTFNMPCAEECINSVVYSDVKEAMRRASDIVEAGFCVRVYIA